MPRYPLRRLVRDGTFLARRHAGYLQGQPYVQEPELRELQRGYRRSQSDQERLRWARAFEHEVKQRFRSPDKISLQEFLYVSCGPGQAEIDALRGADGLVDEDAYIALWQAWEEWDRLYGTMWRLRRGLLTNTDELRLFRALTKVETKDLRLADKLFADHETWDLLDEMLTYLDPHPDPPRRPQTNGRGW